MVAVVLVVLLLLTGLWLWSNYRPGLGAAWSELLSTRADDGYGRVQVVHRWASQALVWDALALLALVLARPDVRRRWPAVAWVVVVALLLGFTGYLLPWDQLALREVTVGTDIKGVAEAWAEHTRFILIGGVEITPATYRRWALAHAVVLPAIALLVPAAVVVAMNRRRRSDERTGEGSSADL